MTIARRDILGLFAASAATALTGCGGGYDRPTRFMWMLNLNERFSSADVYFGQALAASAVAHPTLSARFEVEYGTYNVGLRDRNSSGALDFPGVLVDDLSTPMLVFYRWGGTSARLGSFPSGIVNYFDSAVPLVAELYDGLGNLQQANTLGFETSAPQVSQSSNCQLRLRNSTNSVLVYDSGLRRRTGAILAFALDNTGLVGVVGLDYTLSDAIAVPWPNIL
jgi:hypothetical protein